jgi:aminoglycoside phosphotransferase (APT) family kinase protein
VSEGSGLQPWDVEPFIELDDAQLAAITSRHGLPAATRRLPSTGVIHTIYVLGEQYVLRVPKPIDEGLSDLRTEVVAAPAALAAGVRTPALVVFDESLEIIHVPFTVFELVPGEPLGARPFDPERDADVYRDLGRQLARLHAGVVSLDDPRGWLDHDERPLDALRLVADLVAGSLLGVDAAGWVRSVLERLLPAAEASLAIRRFVHNDVQPNNVMITPAHEAVLIDWGDAAWSDPTRDLNDLVPRSIPLVLAGYREVAPMEDEETVEARILYDHLVAALYHLGRPPTPRDEWGRAPGSRLVELLAEASSPSSWVRSALARS